MGLFSFLVLLTCGDATVNFRQRLVPIHAAFGLATFILAIATCLTGLSQKANLTLGFVICATLTDFIPILLSPALPNKPLLIYLTKTSNYAN